MFMAAKPQTPGSTNTGKVDYQTKQTLVLNLIYLLTSISDLTCSSMILFLSLSLNRNVSVIAYSIWWSGFVLGGERESRSCRSGCSQRKHLCHICSAGQSKLQGEEFIWIKRTVCSKRSLAEVKKKKKKELAIYVIRKNEKRFERDWSPFLFYKVFFFTSNN